MAWLWLVSGLAVVLAAWNFRERKREIKKYFLGIDKKTLALLVVILAIGAAARLQVPSTYRLFGDELWHIEVGKNILLNGRAELCRYEAFDKKYCDDYVKPLGFPLVLSIAFGLFGTTRAGAVSASILFGTLAIAMVFLATRLLFKNDSAALFAAAAAATNPIHVIWSPAAAADATSFFFLAAAVIATVFAARFPSAKSIALALAIFTFAAQTRYENNVAIIPLAILFATLLKKPATLKAPTIAVVALLSALLLVPNAMRVAGSVQQSDTYTNDGGATRAVFSIENAQNNWKQFNPLATLSEPHFPLAFGILVIFGIPLALLKNPRTTFFLLAWIAVFYFIVLFYWGAPEIGRKTMALQLPLFVFGGAALEWIYSAVSSKIRKAIPCKLLLCAMLVILCLAQISLARQYGAFEPDEMFVEALAMNDIESALPKNAYVIVPEPSIINAASITTKGIGLVQVFSQRDVYQRIASWNFSAIPLFYLEDWPCFPEQFVSQERADYVSFQRMEARCRKMHELFELEEYRKYEGNTSGKQNATAPVFRLYRVLSVKAGQ